MFFPKNLPGCQLVMGAAEEADVFAGIRPPTHCPGLNMLKFEPTSLLTPLAGGADIGASTAIPTPNHVFNVLGNLPS